MKKNLLALSAFLLLFHFSFGQLEGAIKFAKSINQDDLKRHLIIYSSDEFEGRDTGSEGQRKAVEYLREQYKSIGVEAGDPDKDYFQPMTLNFSPRRGEPAKDVKTENVISIIKGREIPDEYIVITSHLDHVGVDNGQIYNGADDDGSGTVAMLEIAEAFKLADMEGNGPRRSVVFLHVTGEEKGLLGSKYYTDKDPIYPLENTVVNLNMDMIGRIDPTRVAKNRDYIYLIGTDHDSQELHDVSEESNKKTLNMTLDYRFNDVNDPNRFYYRSDHYNFAKNGIPVIFYFSGIHEDYHKPTDTVDKIEFDLLEMRTQLIFYTAWNIANRENRLSLNNEEDNNSSYKHSEEELKSFEGIYVSETFPLDFKLFLLDNKLCWVPVGGSDEQSLMLDEIGEGKFESKITGLELEFRLKEIKNEIKTVSQRGTVVKKFSKFDKKMILTISGNKINFERKED